MTGDQIQALINKSIGHTLDERDLTYIQRVGRACEASYMLDGIKFQLSRRVKKRDYTKTSNRVSISEDKWLSKSEPERRDLLRRIVCEIIDRELHGSKAGGWEFESLMKNAERWVG